MIYTQAANLTTTAGTKRALASVRTPASWVLIQALEANTGDVYVGGVNPTARTTGVVTAATQLGIRLTPGSSLLCPALDGSLNYDLQYLFFDTAVSSEGVSVTYAD